MPDAERPEESGRAAALLPFRFPACPACPACFCLSLPVRVFIRAESAANISLRCPGTSFPACRMQNGRRNRVGRLLRFGVPPVPPVFAGPACPACLCLSEFLYGQSRQQISLCCPGTSFPACRMRNGRRNRVGRLLRFRFGVSSVCIVRAATESPRRGGLPTPLPLPIRPVSGRQAAGANLPPRGVWRSGCVAARGGVGSGRQGRTQLPGTPSHFLRLPPSPVSGRGFRSRRSGGRRRLRGTAARRVRWPKCSGDWDSGGACRPARVWQRA